MINMPQNLWHAPQNQWHKPQNQWHVPQNQWQARAIPNQWYMPQNQWHVPQNQRHVPQNQWHFLLSLFFAIFKLKLVLKTFGNSCLIDLQIEASLVHF